MLWNSIINLKYQLPGGSQIDHIQPAGGRSPLGEGALARAGAAENEFFHVKELWLFYQRRSQIVQPIIVNFSRLPNRAGASSSQHRRWATQPLALQVGEA